ncbi:hypothetical protein G6F68_010631 [Rhizopus microsporus]|nr:hypothetical protein G6F68_010631 [Rhizopus microsporus]
MCGGGRLRPRGKFAVERDGRVGLPGFAQGVGLQQPQRRAITVALAECIDVGQRGIPGALLLHARDQFQVGVAAVLWCRFGRGQAGRAQVLRRGRRAATGDGGKGEQQAGGAKGGHQVVPIEDMVAASATSAGPARTSISAGSRRIAALLAQADAELAQWLLHRATVCMHLQDQLHQAAQVVVTVDVTQAAQRLRAGAPVGVGHVGFLQFAAEDRQRITQLVAQRLQALVHAESHPLQQAQQVDQQRQLVLDCTAATLDPGRQGELGQQQARCQCTDHHHDLRQPGRFAEGQRKGQYQQRQQQADAEIDGGAAARVPAGQIQQQAILVGQQRGFQAATTERAAEALQPAQRLAARGFHFARFVTRLQGGLERGRRTLFAMAADPAGKPEQGHARGQHQQ